MPAVTRGTTERLNRNERVATTREQNVSAAKAVADMVRTSLGPRGMDKMIEDSKGGVLITNDGATILRETKMLHPAAKMLVGLSEAQDIEAGDGTTSVVVIAGSLLCAASELMEKGLHPQAIARGFIKALNMAEGILDNMAVPVDLTDEQALQTAVATSLQSKVVSSLANSLAPIAVNAMLQIVKPGADNVDLNDVKVVKQLGGTVDDSELVNGLVLAHQRISRIAGGPTSCVNAKVGLIQFCLSLPKTDMDQSVVIKDYTQMDRLLRQERLQIAKMVKQIQATGCNVLLVQKSILREAVNELALDFLAKAKIMVIRDIEREDIDFISRTLGCVPAASMEHFTAESLGVVASVSEDTWGESRVVKFVTDNAKNHTVSVILRATNQLTLEEADRSFRDAICVVRSIVRKRSLLPGGGAPEAEVATRLSEEALKIGGIDEMCVKAYGRALEVIPYTLSENAGLRAVEVVTELRKKHLTDKLKYAGVDVRRGCCCDNIMQELNIVQPTLVTLSALKLATETVVMILKIDDVVLCR